MPKTKTAASSTKTQNNPELKELISATVKLWRKHHLTYDQAGYVGKEIRRQLKIKRAAVRQTVVHRLSRDEEQKLIRQAYRETSTHGLLLKTLFLTGARVSEFVALTPRPHNNPQSELNFCRSCIPDTFSSDQNLKYLRRESGVPNCHQNHIHKEISYRV